MASDAMTNDPKERRGRVIRSALLLAATAVGVYAIYIALVVFGGASGAG